MYELEIGSKVNRAKFISEALWIRLHLIKMIVLVTMHRSQCQNILMPSQMPGKTERTLFSTCSHPCLAIRAVECMKGGDWDTLEVYAGPGDLCRLEFILARDLDCEMMQFPFCYSLKRSCLQSLVA
jgi:hypothetical protein